MKLKKILNCLISFFVFLCLAASTALAQQTQSIEGVSQSDENSADDLPTLDADLSSELSSRTSQDLSRTENARLGASSAGNIFSIDLGYAGWKGGLTSLSYGYAFSNINLSVFTDLNIYWGDDIGVTWIAGVKYIKTWSCFQLSLGLGLGYSYFSDLKSIIYLDGYNNAGNMFDHANDVQAFTLTPVIEFDWFVSRHWFIGFGFDIPVYLGKGHYADYNEYYEQNIVAYGVLYDVKFNAYFHAGVKF